MKMYSKLVSIFRFATSAVLGEFHDEVEIDKALKRELCENGYYSKY